MIVMFTYGIGMLLGSQISGALYNHLVAGQSVPQALGDLLVDPGGGRRGYRADFPFLFPVQRERAALIFQEGYEND